MHEPNLSAYIYKANSDHILKVEYSIDQDQYVVNGSIPYDSTVNLEQVGNPYLRKMLNDGEWLDVIPKGQSGAFCGNAIVCGTGSVSGHASGVVCSSGGTVTVESGGTLTNAYVLGYGSVTISSGGTMQYANIYRNAILDCKTGGVLIGISQNVIG